MNMAAKHVPIRSSRQSMLPVPHRNLKLLDPSNEDIIKALDEVKANQQCFIDNNNKLKQHIEFLDETCIMSYLYLQLNRGIGSQGDWDIEADRYNNLPPL